MQASARASAAPAKAAASHTVAIAGMRLQRQPAFGPAPASYEPAQATLAGDASLPLHDPRAVAATGSRPEFGPQIARDFSSVGVHHPAGARFDARAGAAADHGGGRLLLQRKCGCGASLSATQPQCTECSRKRGMQARRALADSHDPLEREADRVADQILRGPVHPVRSGPPLAIQPVSHQATASAQAPPASVERVLASSGSPLATALRQDMEGRFGYDFSRVRVHADSAAARSAREVDAQAFTAGQHIVFGRGMFAPGTPSGKHLLAHELTHVVQQSQLGAAGATAPVMRKGFESTVEVCHRVLVSRKFDVRNGGVRVVLVANSPDSSVPNCRDFDFGVSLSRSEDWWPDKEIGTCEATTGGTRTFEFGNIPSGTYYLTFWRVFDHPYCCLQGDVLVFDEAVASDGEGCTRGEDLSAMDIVHGALDLAGFVPLLGAIPDGVNAGIYALEGDWANVGLSAVAMVPLWGDGVKLATMGGKAVIKISGKAAVKLGPKGIAKGLKEVRAVSKAAKLTEEVGKAAKVEKELVEGVGKEAAKKLEKEAAEKAVSEAADKAAKEAADKAAKEAADKAAKEAADKAAKEAADKAAKEAADKAAKEAADKAAKEAADKAAKEAAEKTAKEAAEKALQKRIAECLAIHAAYKALGNCSKCTALDTLAERALKIACLTAVIAGRQSYLSKDCDDVLPGSVARGSAIAKRGHQTQVVQLLKMLAKCQTLPTK